MSVFKNEEQVLDFFEALIGANYHERYKLVADLPDKEFEQLRNTLPHIARAMRQLERDAKEVWIDRHTNYDRLVRYPKRHFNDTDIALLEQMHGQDESAYYYRGLDGNGASLIDLRKSVKRLKRRGLVQHVTGLFGEDGTAGSGFMENSRRYDTIEQIITNYRLEQGELAL